MSSLPRTSNRQQQYGQWVVDLTDPSSISDAVKELLQLPIGQKYLAECYTEETSDADLTKIIDNIRVIYPADQWDVTIAVMATTLKQLMLAGVIAKRQDLRPAAPISEPREAVTQLTPEETQEQEWTRWCNDPQTPMHAIKQKRMVDPAFAQFYNRQTRLRVTEEGGVGDAVETVDAPVRNVKQTSKLLAFQDLVQKEPTENLKPKAGYVSVNGEKIRYSEFLELVDRCADAGLSI
jgi:hypothetical protein